MDYLVIEGYKDAAESFVKEANLTPNIDLNSIENRMNIRNAVQSGQIEAAIEMVNDLDPEVYILITRCLIALCLTFCSKDTGYQRITLLCPTTAAFDGVS